eukprot:tig00021036_g17288.t1
MAPSARVVVTRKLPESTLTKLKTVGYDVKMWDSDEPMPRDKLLEWAPGAMGILCMLSDKIDKEVMDKAGPSLKAVSTLSVGYDHIDMQECAKRKIAVGYTPEILTQATADLTLALLMSVARRVPEGVNAVKTGEWSSWKPFWLTGWDVYGKTVGILGLGRIGQAVAKRLAGGFDCKILYTGNRPVAPEIEKALNATFVPNLDDMLPQCDIVTLHCPFHKDRYRMFNKEMFAKFKKNAIFLNTARGGFVDQDALYEALSTGVIGAAGLDVTDPEPLPTTHKLLTLNNCVILPHIGSATVDTRMEMSACAAENLHAGIAGTDLVYQVPYPAISA